MRLLLAEDEQALSKALTAILERNNYSVDAVFDGQAALEYLESDNYDGVILMPKKDGITVLRELRSRGNRVPVCFLPPNPKLTTRCWGWMPGPTITSPNPSSPGSCWPVSGP